MDSQLVKSTIKSILEEKGFLRAKGKVHSLIFKEDMNLIGFVPYYESDWDILLNQNLDINLNESLIVTPNRIRFKDGESSYPVLKNVSKPKQEKYRFDRSLRIIDMPSSLMRQSWFIAYFNEPDKCGRIVIQELKKRKPTNLFHLSKSDEGYLEYQVQQDDYEFTRDYGNYTCIGYSFLCLCSFINKITGLPAFALFDPQDIIKVMSEEDESR